MSTLNKWLTGVLVLIGLYLLVMNANSANSVLKALADSNVSWIKALQGR